MLCDHTRLLDAGVGLPDWTALTLGRFGHAGPRHRHNQGRPEGCYPGLHAVVSDELAVNCKAQTTVALEALSIDYRFLHPPSN